MRTWHYCKHVSSSVVCYSVHCCIVYFLSFEIDGPGELGVVTLICEHTVAVLLVKVRLDGVGARGVLYPLFYKMQMDLKTICAVQK